MVAVLARAFGPAHLDLAEEVVQEALVRALRSWPFRGVPEDPAAWLYRVARNLALDHLRRDTRLHGKESEVRAFLDRRAPQHPTRVHFREEITDDQLRLIFLCCHPDLPIDSRVALTLKTVGGFSAKEIARAFLAKEATIAQRLTRAQRRIRQRHLPLAVPDPEHLGDRLDAVLEVLYLMFNEGYGCHGGDALVRADLCAEALQLTIQLTHLHSTRRPRVHALAALLALQFSRLSARLDDQGELVPLADQDRGRWDPAALSLGFEHLERAAQGQAMSTYHLQAAIAAHHAMAADDASTDWVTILELYDQLWQMTRSPIIALNRAVAVARVEGPPAGLAALDDVTHHPSLRGYYLLPATRADFLLHDGQTAAALHAFQQALGCSCSEPERRFLQRRIAECGGATQSSAAEGSAAESAK